MGGERERERYSCIEQCLLLMLMLSNVVSFFIFEEDNGVRSSV